MDTLTDKELRLLVSLAKRALWAGKEVKRVLQKGGVNVTPANFYSSVPLVADIEDSFEYREERSGIAPYIANGLFDSDIILAFAREIGIHACDFNPPLEGDREDPAGFFWNNPAFSRSDAMAYYCMLRALRPQRVVEIGSGFSTLVADAAIKANGHGEIVVIEPYPMKFLRKLDSVSRIIEQPVQMIPETELVDLINSAQVWFIDSTHTVKSGSDCLYIYLKIMPRITSEVMCHSHDIFLPYGMPPAWALERNIFWTEQYLLLAYLLDNPKADIVFGSCYLKKALPEASEMFMHGRFESGGGSLWYRLNRDR
jgi:hypothetical protein